MLIKGIIKLRLARETTEDVDERKASDKTASFIPLQTQLVAYVERKP